MIHRKHFADFEGARESPAHHQAVFQHVGDAAGGAGIVFQHQVLARAGIAHQIDAGDVDIDVARHSEPHHFAAEMLAGIDQMARNDAVFQNPLLPVDVLQIEVERHHALRESALDHVPFGAGDNARHQVEGEEPLRSAAVAVNREGDALNQVGKIGQFAPLFENLERHVGELIVHGGGPRARDSVGQHHLVVKRAGVVAIKEKLGTWMCHWG